MSGNVAPPAVSRPCHLFLALHRGVRWVGGFYVRVVFSAVQPGCRHAASTSPVLTWTPAARLRAYVCFFIKAVGLKAAGDFEHKKRG